MRGAGRDGLWRRVANSLGAMPRGFESLAPRQFCYHARRLATLRLAAASTTRDSAAGPVCHPARIKWPCVSIPRAAGVHSKRQTRPGYRDMVARPRPRGGMVREGPASGVCGWDWGTLSPDAADPGTAYLGVRCHRQHSWFGATRARFDSSHSDQIARPVRLGWGDRRAGLPHLPSCSDVSNRCRLRPARRMETRMPAEFKATINGVEVSSFDEGVRVLRDIRNAYKQENRADFLEEMRARKEADKAAREQAPGLPEGAEGGPPAEAAGDATI